MDKFWLVYTAIGEVGDKDAAVINTVLQDSIESASLSQYETIFDACCQIATINNCKRRPLTGLQRCITYASHGIRATGTFCRPPTDTSFDTRCVLMNSMYLMRDWRVLQMSDAGGFHLSCPWLMSLSPICAVVLCTAL